MDPWSDEAAVEEGRAWRLAQDRRAAAARLPKKIALPKKPKPPSRDALTRPVPTMRELAEFVGEVRAGLGIPQAQLAARAGISRQWLVALESGRPTVAAGKVFRTLEALGFELTVTPYDPAPPWMLWAVRDAAEKREMVAREARRRRNGRRARAKLSRLAQSVTGEGLDLG